MVEKKLEETITNQTKELEKLTGKVVSLTTEVLDLEKPSAVGVNSVARIDGSAPCRARSARSGTLGDGQSLTNLEGGLGGLETTVTKTVNDLGNVEGTVTGLGTIVTDWSKADRSKRPRHLKTVGNATNATN